MKEEIRKRRKRANGEGCIRKLPNGRWEARITDGYNSNGTQHFKTFSSSKQSVVVKKLEEFKKYRKMFDSNIAQKYTVKEWLNIWLDTYVKNNVRTSTRISYEGIIKNHLIPNIGKIKLIDLKKVHIEKMYYNLLDNGNKSYKKGALSVKTIKNIHLVLHEALKEAVEREYILKNPASIVKVPTMKSQDIEKKEIEIYTKEEQVKLMQEAGKDDIYGSIVLFALYTGMRKGEIIGLKWNDIDFQNNIIDVNKQLSRLKNYDTNNYKNKTSLIIQNHTKTNNSIRKIPMTDNLIVILKSHYEKQQENKKRIGSKYCNNDMVFCREDGSLLDPDTVLSKYKKIAKNAGIKQCTFHALRHTFATRALESSMTPKIVSSILGHASVQFTLDTYVHALDDKKIEEMNVFDEFMNSIAI